jgi:hypothetical protein
VSPKPGGDLFQTLRVYFKELGKSGTGNTVETKSWPALRGNTLFWTNMSWGHFKNKYWFNWGTLIITVRREVQVSSSLSSKIA